MSPSKRVINWIEINFWNVAIPWMTESDQAKTIFTLGTKAANAYKPIPTPIKYIFLALAALVIGLSLGYAVSTSV